jgi:hypothetical protein
MSSEASSGHHCVVAPYGQQPNTPCALVLLITYRMLFSLSSASRVATTGEAEEIFSSPNAMLAPMMHHCYLVWLAETAQRFPVLKLWSRQSNRTESAMRDTALAVDWISRVLSTTARIERQF